MKALNEGKEIGNAITTTLITYNVVMFSYKIGHFIVARVEHLSENLDSDSSSVGLLNLVFV